MLSYMQVHKTLIFNLSSVLFVKLSPLFVLSLQGSAQGPKSQLSIMMLDQNHENQNIITQQKRNGTHWVMKPSHLALIILLILLKSLLLGAYIQITRSRGRYQPGVLFHIQTPQSSEFFLQRPTSRLV